MCSARADVLRDLSLGMLNWHMWTRMGWQEIKRRYRRTFIGPFWATLSLGVFILTLGILWARLWHQDTKTYLPYLCAGMITWVLVSTIITDGCTTFTSAEGLIKQFNFRYSMLPCSIVWRNLIVFAHNAVIFVAVGIYAGVPVGWSTFLIVPGLALICLTGVWVGILLGMICARYRDIVQIVISLLQISTFVTPIFYRPDQLTGRLSVMATYNFLYHYVDIVRSPLLGFTPAPISYVVTGSITILGWIMTIYFYGRFRRRIPYWL
ncbi:MAG: ABC transporter permease [Alphaproteobacteria bacterium]|nr:ABC transporter permease [Alphaproteobacteria bacterium]